MINSLGLVLMSNHNDSVGSKINIIVLAQTLLGSRKFKVTLIALILYFGHPAPELNQLEQIIERGTLQVATRIGPLSYYEREGEPNGLDYNLLTEFAHSIGVELEVTVFDSLDDQIASVYSPDTDVAGATLTATKSRMKHYEFSEPYLEVSTLLIQHSSLDSKDSIEEIIAEPYRLMAIEGSSHAELLNQIQNEFPALHWDETRENIMFQLMEKVQNRELDYSVVDSSIYELERSMFPRIEIALQLTESEPIGLLFAKGKDTSLVDAVDQFLIGYKSEGKLEILKNAYFQDQGRMDVAGSLLFKERLENRLPGFEPLFRSVAEEYNYDWLLLAAQAYQESHWEPKARSPTGVRGLMMLTLPTAKQLGVKNRLDPEQSLRGGIKYLLSLHSRLPARIVEPDKTKFALAAYNVGFGHLEDARILTQRGGANPDLWKDVEQYLPLLRQKKYYSTVKRGYARGTEPVSYVNNIYRFKSILDWYTWQRELELDNIFVEPSKEQVTPYDDILDPPLSPL